MKIIAFITFLTGITISINSHALGVLSFDDLEWSNRSGSVYGSSDYQSPQNIRIVKFHDFSDYYLYIELEGIKPEEVDIQRQGPRITIQQVRGRMEESESRNSYRAVSSFSSFTRSLMLPPDADPDVSKMQRENNANYIRLKIPKRSYTSLDHSRYD